MLEKKEKSEQIIEIIIMLMCFVISRLKKAKLKLNVYSELFLFLQKTFEL